MYFGNTEAGFRYREVKLLTIKMWVWEGRGGEGVGSWVVKLESDPI